MEAIRLNNVRSFFGGMRPISDLPQLYHRLGSGYRITEIINTDWKLPQTPAFENERKNK